MIVSWMLYTCALTASVTAIATAVEPLFQARRRATRWVWVAAIATSLGVSLAMAIRPQEVSAVVQGGAAVGVAAVTTDPQAGEASWPSGDTLALLLWGASSLAMLAIVAAGVRELRRIRARAPRMRLGGEVVSLVADVGPGTTWFGEPRILVPAWAKSLGDDAVALLVRHEREHARAGDPGVLALSLLALVAMPWNLPLWLVARRLRAAIEIDCDARVLSAGGDVHRYGELLLSVAHRRGRRTPSVLLPFAAFATSSSSLERRIRAMTERPLTLTLRRLAASGAVVAAALVAACEMRRPEPLAPVTTYTVKDGTAKAAPSLSPSQGDSVRRTLEGELRMKSVDTVLAGNPTDPVLMVYNSTGMLLEARRLGGGVKGDDALGIPREAIASVDVIKNGEWLPKNARGGVIRVVLKPGAEEMRPSGAGSAIRKSEADEGTRVSEGEKIALSKDVLMVVYDADGKELARSVGPALTKRIDPGQVATVNVFKNSAQLPADAPQGMVKIVLKPGASLKP